MSDRHEDVRGTGRGSNNNQGVITINTTSLAQLKRYIGREARLVLAEIDGTLWASNRYWLVRAAHIQPFLDKYGITGPGVYDYDGQAAEQDRLANTDHMSAELARLADITAYTTDLKPVSVGEWFGVYARDGEHYLELLEDPGEVDPEPVAVRADWLDWLEGAPAGTDDDLIYENCLAVTERRRPIAIIARPLAPSEGEEIAPRLVAVVMPTRDPAAIRAEMDRWVPADSPEGQRILSSIEQAP